MAEWNIDNLWDKAKEWGNKAGAPWYAPKQVMDSPSTNTGTAPANNLGTAFKPPMSLPVGHTYVPSGQLLNEASSGGIAPGGGFVAGGFGARTGFLGPLDASSFFLSPAYRNPNAAQRAFIAQWIASGKRLPQDNILFKNLDTGYGKASTVSPSAGNNAISGGSSGNSYGAVELAQAYKEFTDFVSGFTAAGRIALAEPGMFRIPRLRAF